MFMERRKIVELWQSGGAGVLVTLVRAEGSSYRRPGARLLTGSSEQGGAYAGTISGGCLEAEVSRKAAWLARNGAHVERYSMLFDDTAEIPFNLGCGGVVDLLFEPIDTAEGEALLAALAGSLAGKRKRVITFLPRTGSDAERRPLRRLILDSAGEVIFASPQLTAEKIACARRLEPSEVHDGRFVEQLDPPQRLMVLGAGDDVRPLVSMAALLGWSVVVADGRAQLARAGRFPTAETVLALSTPEQIAESLLPRSDDAVVLMTHSYEQDRDLLAAVLPLGPRYVGLLGSRHRSALLISEVAARLGHPLARCCERIYAPVGLDLGGDGPEAIALAILSEVQAICQGGRSMRLPITEDEVIRQLARGGAEPYLNTQCAMDAV